MPPASRFAVLGQEESCTGDPARRMGNDYVFQMLATGNVETLDRYGMGERTIVTACPHCFNTIGNEYGQLGGTYKVVHHSTFLAGLSSIRPARDGPGGGGSSTGDHRPGSVTVHDSCYLARYNGVIAAPRDVLGAAGVSITEMEKSGKNTFCCGAGGGRMWMEETRGTRINEERTRQVLETGAATVATSCPFCMVMMTRRPGRRRRRHGGHRDGHQRGAGGPDRVGAGGAAAPGGLIADRRATRHCATKRRCTIPLGGRRPTWSEKVFYDPTRRKRRLRPSPWRHWRMLCETEVESSPCGASRSSRSGGQFPSGMDNVDERGVASFP